MTKNEKLYIVTRSDLCAGLKIAQCCHALREFSEKYRDIDSTWFKESNYLVVLEVKDEDSLKSQINSAELADLKFAAFYEPDLDNQITAVAFEPCDKSRNLFRRLPLAGK